jgi:hypothetical protein
MRLISGPALAQLNAESMRVALLVEMMLSAPVRLCTANVNLDWAGSTYIGTGVLGAVNEVDDSPGEYKNLTFTLSGVDLAVISIALSENVSNKRVTVREAIIDSNSFAVLDAPVIWTGIMDQMPVQRDDDTATVSVSAEHRGITFARAKPINYTEVDQARIDPADTSLRFIQSQSTHQDVWPAASWGRV